MSPKKHEIYSSNERTDKERISKRLLAAAASGALALGLAGCTSGDGENKDNDVPTSYETTETTVPAEETPINVTEEEVELSPAEQNSEIIKEYTITEYIRESDYPVFIAEVLANHGSARNIVYERQNFLEVIRDYEQNPEFPLGYFDQLGKNLAPLVNILKANLHYSDNEPKFNLIAKEAARDVIINVDDIDDITKDMVVSNLLDFAKYLPEDAVILDSKIDYIYFGSTTSEDRHKNVTMARFLVQYSDGERLDFPVRISRVAPDVSERLNPYEPFDSGIWGDEPVEVGFGYSEVSPENNVENDFPGTEEYIRKIND